MIRLQPGGVLLLCDENRAGACPASLWVSAEDWAWTMEVIMESARDSGWRAYLPVHRRDLCPEHANIARRRLHRVGRTLETTKGTT